MQASIYKPVNINKFLSRGYQDNFNPVINLRFASFALCDKS
jgi:hypothetical protein